MHKEERRRGNPESEREGFVARILNQILATLNADFRERGINEEVFESTLQRLHAAIQNDGLINTEKEKMHSHLVDYWVKLDKLPHMTRGEILYGETILRFIPRDRWGFIQERLYDIFEKALILATSESGEGLLETAHRKFLQLLTYEIDYAEKRFSEEKFDGRLRIKNSAWMLSTIFADITSKESSDTSENMEALRRYAKSTAIAFLDINYLKGVNDIFGHAVGDRLIERICQALQHLSLPGYTIDLSMIGGDEIILLIRSETDIDKEVTKNIRAACLEAIISISTNQIFGGISMDDWQSAATNFDRVAKISNGNSTTVEQLKVGINNLVPTTSFGLAPLSLAMAHKSEIPIPEEVKTWEIVVIFYKKLLALAEIDSVRSKGFIKQTLTKETSSRRVNGKNIYQILGVGRESELSVSIKLYEAILYRKRAYVNRFVYRLISKINELNNIIALKTLSLSSSKINKSLPPWILEMEELREKLKEMEALRDKIYELINSLRLNSQTIDQKS